MHEEFGMRTTGIALGVMLAAVVVFAALAGRADPSHLKARETPARPKILGIAGVEIVSSDVAATNLFYGRLVELDGACNWCENNPYTVVDIPSGQVLGLTPSRRGPPKSMLASIVFIVDSEKTMKRWLLANNVPFKAGAGPYRDRDTYLFLFDPEGHKIYFRNAKHWDKTDYGHLAVLDAGFAVKDRQQMDKFYKDTLGFRMYWQGGKKDGETDWVDMQVPDGTDWIEYMLNVPENADRQTLGAMNHIALGVPDVRAAAKTLEEKGVDLPEEPKIGRDGKWELNLYDPDGTRVELLEFTPVKKPCCSEYSGPHPKP
jgi:catechol 2,3-dioxygenase-like lactoylglutathione lyase family enzyme